MSNLLTTIVFYLFFGLILIIVNDPAVWFTFSGILLIFEWQVICALLFAFKPDKRLSIWKNMRVVSHIHYVIVLIGAFLAIKSWFPTANNIGLIILGILFFCLKDLSFRVCKYKAIAE